MSLDAKRRAIEELESACDAFERRMRGLTAAQLDLPVWTGEGDGWRIRDLLAHCATWLRVSAAIAERVAAGQLPPEEGTPFRAYLGWPDVPVPEFNGRAFEEWRGRTVDEQFAELRAAYEALMELVRALPASGVVKDDGEPYRYLRQPVRTHIGIHLAHVDDALGGGSAERPASS